MEEIEKAKKLIQEKENILIVPSYPLKGDSVGSSFALFFTLKKLKKNVNIVFPSKLPEECRFFKDYLDEFSKELIISITDSENVIEEIKYEKDSHEVKIIIPLEGEKIKKQDVSFSFQEVRYFEDIDQFKKFSFPFDLLIVLGFKEKKEIERVLKKEISEISLINIDNRSDNENFGTVNLISFNSSLGEIVLNLLHFFEKELIDSSIATSLLFSFFSFSRNFTNKNITPHFFEGVAFLLEKGADHQKIIDNLFKPKSLSQIKIFGRVLENLQYHKQLNLWISSLQEKDFKECKATSKDLKFALEQIKLNPWDFSNFLLLWESHSSPLKIKGVGFISKKELLEKILNCFGGERRFNNIMFETKERSLTKVQEEILKTLTH